MSFVYRPRAVIKTYRFFWCRYCDRTVRITSSAHANIFPCPLCYNLLCQELHISRPNFTVQDNEPSSSSAAQLLDTMAQMSRPNSSPPSSTIEECMPFVRVTVDMLENNPSCAVCKDDFVVDEQIRKLPCCHLYHSGCILPWIQIHDTCPICRHRVAVPQSSDNGSNIGGLQGVSHYVDQDDIDDFRFEEAMNLTWPSWSELLSLWPFSFGSFFNWSSHDHEDSLIDTATSTTGSLLNVFSLEF